MENKWLQQECVAEATSTPIAKPRLNARWNLDEPNTRTRREVLPQVQSLGSDEPEPQDNFDEIDDLVDCLQNANITTNRRMMRPSTLMYDSEWYRLVHAENNLNAPAPPKNIANSLSVEALSRKKYCETPMPSRITKPIPAPRRHIPVGGMSKMSQSGGQQNHENPNETYAVARELHRDSENINLARNAYDGALQENVIDDRFCQ